MAKPEKELIVKEVADKFAKASSVLFADFTGLKVEEMNELRSAFRKASVEYRVVKNTLARLALKEAGYEHLCDYLTGPTSFAFGGEDPVAPAKIITDFAKKIDKPKIKACLFEGKLLEPSQVDQIAKLPSREILLSRVAAGVNGPLVSFVWVLQSLLQNLVLVLDAIKREKE